MALSERRLSSFGCSAGPVMLPLLYNNNYEIAQTKDTVAILLEMVHDARVIHIGARHRTDGLGISVLFDKIERAQRRRS